MKFSIKDFFSKYDQIRIILQILSHLLKKSLMEKFIFCAVTPVISGVLFSIGEVSRLKIKNNITNKKRPRFSRGSTKQHKDIFPSNAVTIVCIVFLIFQ